MKPIDRLKIIAKIPYVIASRRTLMSWYHLSKSNAKIRLFTKNGRLIAQECRYVNYYSGAKWEWVSVYKTFHPRDLQDYAEMQNLPPYPLTDKSK